MKRKVWKKMEKCQHIHKHAVTDWKSRKKQSMIMDLFWFSCVVRQNDRYHVIDKIKWTVKWLRGKKTIHRNNRENVTSIRHTTTGKHDRKWIKKEKCTHNLNTEITDKQTSIFFNHQLNVQFEFRETHHANFWTHCFLFWILVWQLGDSGEKCSIFTSVCLRPKGKRGGNVIANQKCTPNSNRLLRFPLKPLTAFMFAR